MTDFASISEDLKQRIEKSRRRVIDSIGKNMDLYGITLSIGHLYGNMYFSRQPVTLDEMVDTMGMSKTSMSTGMRTLTDLKMVHRVWGKGSRKDLFEVEADWYQTFVDFFSIKWRKSIEQNDLALSRSLTELNQLLEEHPDNDELTELVRVDIAKIKSALAYYRWLERLIDSFESGEIYTLIPKEPE